MGVSGQRHIPTELYRRLVVNGCGKSRPPPLGFDPRTFQTLASCYTDYGIPAHSKNLGLI